MISTSQYVVIDETLGVAGAMLSPSKRTPIGCEDHTIFWNSCVFAQRSKKDYQQTWWGDLDVTAKADQLQELADRLGVVIWATPEHPYRWDGFLDGRKGDHRDRAVRFDPK